MKIRLCSHPCAGKTSFIRENRRLYRGYTLIDCDEVVGSVNDALLTLAEGEVLIGNEVYRMHPDVLYLAVAPNEEKIARNLRRRQEIRKGKACKWSIPINIFTARALLLDSCEKFEIPVYECFYSALNSVL